MGNRNSAHDPGPSGKGNQQSCNFKRRQPKTTKFRKESVIEIFTVFQSKEGYSIQIQPSHFESLDKFERNTVKTFSHVLRNFRIASNRPDIAFDENKDEDEIWIDASSVCVEKDVNNEKHEVANAEASILEQDKPQSRDLVDRADIEDIHSEEYFEVAPETIELDIAQSDVDEDCEEWVDARSVDDAACESFPAKMPKKNMKREYVPELEECGSLCKTKIVNQQEQNFNQISGISLFLDEEYDNTSSIRNSEDTKPLTMLNDYYQGGYLPDQEFVSSTDFEYKENEQEQQESIIQFQNSRSLVYANSEPSSIDKDVELFVHKGTANSDDEQWQNHHFLRYVYVMYPMIRQVKPTGNAHPQRGINGKTQEDILNGNGNTGSAQAAIEAKKTLDVDSGIENESLFRAQTPVESIDQIADLDEAPMKPVDNSTDINGNVIADEQKDQRVWHMNKLYKGLLPSFLREKYGMTDFDSAKELRQEDAEPIDIETDGDLDEIDINGNEIEDIEPISMDTEGDLDAMEMNGNEIEDAEPIGMETDGNHEVVDINGNEIDDAEPIGMTTDGNLEEIDMNGNEIEDAEPIDIETDGVLEEIDMNGNEIEDIEPIDIETDGVLEEMDMNCNVIEDAEPIDIETDRDLEEVDMNGNEIEDAEPIDIETDGDLEEMDMNCNVIEDAEPISMDTDRDLDDVDINENVIEKIQNSLTENSTTSNMAFEPGPYKAFWKFQTKHAFPFEVKKVKQASFSLVHTPLPKHIFGNFDNLVHDAMWAKNGTLIPQELETKEKYVSWKEIPWQSPYFMHHPKALTYPLTRHSLYHYTQHEASNLSVYPVRAPQWFATPSFRQVTVYDDVPEATGVFDDTGVGDAQADATADDTSEADEDLHRVSPESSIIVHHPDSSIQIRRPISPEHFATQLCNRLDEFRHSHQKPLYHRMVSVTETDNSFN